MKKCDKIKAKLLEVLERTPIVQSACEQVGISRNTFYRWIWEDPDFAYAYQQSIQTGIDLVNDVAESNVLKGIKRGDISMTKYWLNSRHPAYRKPVIISQQSPLDIKLEAQKEREEHERVVKEISEWQERWTGEKTKDK